MADYPQSKATFDHVIGQAPSQGGLVNLARRNTVAHIVGTARSGAGGILRLLAFAFASIQQAKAWGTDLEYLLRETLTLRDFQHGTVEVRIKELNPRTFILDNPEEAIEIVPVGSGQTEVRQFQVTGAQLANFLAASQDTANTHNIGQRDLFIQQQQRADLGQNGTTGSGPGSTVGSSDSRPSGPSGNQGTTGSTGAPPPTTTPSTTNENPTNPGTPGGPPGGEITINTAPTITVAATDATGSVKEDVDVVAGNLSTTGKIAFNDIDLTDTHTTSVTANAGNTLGGTLAMGPVNESTGTVTWTYTVANGATDHLAAGQSVTESFAITISDGNAGGTVEQVVTVTVNGTNDAPVVTGAVEGSATEDGATSTLDALANASDVDDGTTLSVTNIQADLPPGVTFDGAHSFTLDPTNDAYQHLADGATTTVTVNYEVSDGITSTPASMTWTVTGINDAPEANNDMGVSSIVDASLSSHASASGTGADFVLTTDVTSQAGAVWSDSKISLDSSFTISANLNFGSKDASGADGISFVIQNNSNTIIGGAGGGLGYQGIANSVAIEFDTFDNGIATHDIANDHAAFDTGGVLNAIGGPFDLGDIEDNQFHAVEISWDAETHVLSFSIETSGGTVTGSQIIDNIADILGSNEAYIGFTGSTGASSNVQQVQGLSFQGFSLVTGDVLDNDTDVDTADSGLTVTSVRTGGAEGAGTPGTLGSGLVGEHGTLTLNSDGSYTYVVTDPDAQDLTGDATLTDTFNYTVSDGSLTDMAVLIITINGTPSDPNDFDNGFPGTEDQTQAGTSAGETLSAAGQIDVLIGLGGDDTLYGNNGGGFLYGGSGDDKLHGGTGSDKIYGGSGSDHIFGDNGNDRLFGGSGVDMINGGNGSDLIVGGFGADNLTGGSGSNVFKYLSVGDSTPSEFDVITDFPAGANKVDLSTIDADVNSGGTRHFTTVTNSSTVTANQVTWFYDSGSGQTIVRADVTGDMTADLEIHLVGNVALHQSDFLMA